AERMEATKGAIMSLLMDAERVGETIGITAMGNEGAHWIGMAPFVDTPHVVQNFGDGTYLHSGQLAIQAAIGAGTTITFKILHNDTVAMTGGQQSTHRLDVSDLARILLAQGVSRVLVTSDDPDAEQGDLPPGVEVWDRTRIVEAQERLAAVPGVTVLIHHQACAAELRRDRKRGRLAPPATRVVINHRICEGCGDCGDVSNCLSVQPLPTALGSKTHIDQPSCNHDLSCLEGDCPAFMTVTVAEPARSGSRPRVPAPRDPARVDGTPDMVTLRLAGIGGTGVVTIAQILSTAGMLDGWDVRGLDQTGLSQKAGPVVSDVILARPGVGSSNLIGAGEADVILAFDQLVAAGDGVIAAEGRTTRVVGSTQRVPTGAMISRPELAYPEPRELQARLDARTATDDLWMDAADLTERLVGDSTPANVFVLGAALQAGLVPVAAAAVREAIGLNGVAVEANLAALDWGRSWVDDPEAVIATAAAQPSERDVEVVVPELPDPLTARVAEMPNTDGLREIVTLRAADLVAYQNRAYAARYLDVIERVVSAERAVADSVRLAAAVARGLHRFMAYKDEYEVARLLLAPEARAAARAAGGGGRVVWHLHPPVLRSLGLRRKLRFGRWSRPVMRLLAAGRRVRGRGIDPFGRSEVRRLERELIVEYEQVVERLLAGLSGSSLDRAVEIAELADLVRGFEQLKVRRAREYRAAVAAALADYPSRQSTVE
ncbi:MAG: DUF6537 domain-containing protein, partial [Acidimicrobiales bacterium]